MFLLEVVSAKLIYNLTLIALTAIVVLTLASQFGQYLYLELTTHFRLQYVLVAIICALLLTVFQAWKFVPIAILCGVLNAVYLVPYLTNPRSAGLGRAQAATPAAVRVLHANVLKSNKDYNAVFDLVNRSNADLVVLQEITDDWQVQIQPIAKTYPHFKSVPGLEGAGMAVFSRIPFEDVQVLMLDSSTHVAIAAKVNLEGREVTFLSLHPPTPITASKFENRNQQFREAAKFLNSIKGTKILIGDLNTTMWSPYFRTLLRTTHLRDVRLGFGLKTSWPMPLPSFMRLPIDHCLVSDDIDVKNVQIGARIGSDHRPLIVDLDLP
jgi:endonuclease/exonuclease/phosphatase (EEP) superfamily protein YafD